MTFDIFRKLPAAARDDGERKLVSFRVGEVRCGADIMKVKEIVNVQDIVPVPAAPRFIMGAADHRECMVPVIDLCKRLGLEPSESRRPKWVIVDANGTDVALLVDMVHGVVGVDNGNRREKHPLVEGADEKWVSSVYSLSGELIFEIDIDAIAGVGTVLEPVASSLEDMQ